MFFFIELDAVCKNIYFGHVPFCEMIRLGFYLPGKVNIWGNIQLLSHMSKSYNAALGALYFLRSRGDINQKLGSKSF